MRPVAFTRQMDPEKSTLTIYRVHVMSNMDSKGNVKFLTYQVMNLAVKYIAPHSVVPFHEAKSAIPGATWHEF